MSIRSTVVSRPIRKCAAPEPAVSCILWILHDGCGGLQALWWAWSHAQRMKGLNPPECAPLQGQSFDVSQPDSCHASTSPDSTQGPWLSSSQGSPEWNYSSHQKPSKSRQSLHAHRLNVSGLEDMSADAVRVRRSVRGFDYMQDTSPESSPRSFSICEDDLRDDLADEPYLPALDQREVCRLQRLWQYHLQLAEQASI